MTGVIIFTLIHGIFIRFSFILDDWWGNYNKIYTWFDIESSLTKNICILTLETEVVPSHTLSCHWEPENKRNSTTYRSPRSFSEVSVEIWVSHHSQTTPYCWQGNVYRHHGNPGELVSQSQLTHGIYISIYIIFQAKTSQSSIHEKWQKRDG
jgi:hypothetical protein